MRASECPPHKEKGSAGFAPRGARNRWFLWVWWNAKAAPAVGLDVSKGAYVVVKRLPKHNGEFEYQIKSVSEIDERIVRESQLKPSPWRNQAGRPYSA